MFLPTFHLFVFLFL